MTASLEYEGNKFYFHIGERQAARALVLKYHYSGRCHENPTLVGSLLVVCFHNLIIIHGL